MKVLQGTLSLALIGLLTACGGGGSDGYYNNSSSESPNNSGNTSKYQLKSKHVFITKTI